MPTIHDLKTSKFLTKADVMTPTLVTIRGYDRVNVALAGAEPDEKYVLHFNETEKPLVLNSTNGQIIAAMTGSEDFDGWIGRKVVLYNDASISYGGRVTGGIRARAPKNQPATTAPAATAPAAALAPTPESDDVPF